MLLFRERFTTRRTLHSPFPMRLRRRPARQGVEAEAELVAVLDDKDIPGNNNVSTLMTVEDVEPMLASGGKVLYHSQAVALVLAESRAAASPTPART